MRHSLFRADNGAMGLCNDGAIIGRSLGTVTSSSLYMSQLTINLTASLSVIGQTIECVYRTYGGVETAIGSATIEIAGNNIKY